MKDKKQGVQKRVLDINFKTFYTLCGCHNLNLVYVIWLIYLLELFVFLELCNIFILYLLHPLNDGKFCKIMYANFLLNHYLKVNGRLELKESKQ